MGHADFVRNRPAEFNLRDVPKAELLARLANLRDTVGETLAQLTEADLAKQYPAEVLGYPMTTGYFLTHLYGHLNYHPGQINKGVKEGAPERPREHGVFVNGKTLGLSGAPSFP